MFTSLGLRSRVEEINGENLYAGQILEDCISLKAAYEAEEATGLVPAIQKRKVAVRCAEECAYHLDN